MLKNSYREFQRAVLVGDMIVRLMKYDSRDFGAKVVAFDTRDFVRGMQGKILQAVAIDT